MAWTGSRLEPDCREQLFRPGPEVEVAACERVQGFVERRRSGRGFEVQGFGDIGEDDGRCGSLGTDLAGMGVEMVVRVFFGEEIGRRYQSIVDLPGVEVVEGIARGSGPEEGKKARRLPCEALPVPGRGTQQSIGRALGPGQELPEVLYRGKRDGRSAPGHDVGFGHGRSPLSSRDLKKALMPSWVESCFRILSGRSSGTGPGWS